jgi:hypothetical protein
MFLSAATYFLVIFRAVFWYSLIAVSCYAADSEQAGKIDGYHVIVLDKETQKLSGLQTMEARAAGYRPEFIAYGKSISIQPLLELRNNYLLALTGSQSAAAKFRQSEQSIKRVEDLYRNGIAAKRRLQEQQSQWQVDKSQVDAAHFQGRAIAGEARLIWGKQLADWAMAADSSRLDVFVSGQKTLLQITLQANRQLPDDVRTIFVEASGDRGKAQEARLISIAPETDNTVQGTGYFFETEGKGISIGMSVSAWIPEQKEPVPGVVIPKSAVIRSMDQMFVYIKTSENQFSRRLLMQAKPAADGYFVGAAIKSGEKIVTTGGQMLLSEELRGQIPDDDE